MSKTSEVKIELPLGWWERLLSHCQGTFKIHTASDLFALVKIDRKTLTTARQICKMTERTFDILAVNLGLTRPLLLAILRGSQTSSQSVSHCSENVLPIRVIRLFHKFVIASAEAALNHPWAAKIQLLPIRVSTFGDGPRNERPTKPDEHEDVPLAFGKVSTIFPRPNKSKILGQTLWNYKLIVAHTVVLGEPGAGKSFLAQSSLISISHDALRLIDERDAGNSPIAILFKTGQMPNINNYEKATDAIIDAILALGPECCRESSSFKVWLIKKIQSSDCRFIIDGVDEFHKDDTARLTSLLEFMRIEQWRTKVLFTCRTAHLHERTSHLPDNCKFFNIDQLQTRDIEHHIGKRFNSDLVRAESLLTALRRERALFAACAAPLILTLVCEAHSQSELSESITITGIYSRILEDFLRRRWKGPRNSEYRSEILLERMLNLRCIARNLFLSNPSRHVFTIDNFVKSANELNLSREAILSFLNELVVAGVVIPISGQQHNCWRFFHRSLADHLVAHGLALAKDGKARCLENRYDPGWHEIILQFASIIPPREALMFINNLKSKQRTDQDLFFRPTLLASLAAARMGHGVIPDQVRRELMKATVTAWRMRVRPYESAALAALNAWGQSIAEVISEDDCSPFDAEILVNIGSLRALQIGINWLEERYSSSVYHHAAGVLIIEGLSNPSVLEALRLLNLPRNHRATEKVKMRLFELDPTASVDQSIVEQSWYYDQSLIQERAEKFWQFIQQKAGSTQKRDLERVVKYACKCNTRGAIAFLKELSRHRMASRRKLLINALEWNSTVDTRAILLKLTKDPDPEVRFNALRIISDSSPHEIRDECFALTTKRDYLYGRVAWCTVQNGGSARAKTLYWTVDWNSNYRTVAYHALGRIADIDSINLLLQQLPIEEGEVKAAIVEALGEAKSKRAIPHLIPLINFSGDLAKAAAKALGNIGAVEAAKPLRQLLQTCKNVQFLDQIITTLALLQDKDSILPLKRILYSSDDETLVVSSANALVKLSSDDAIRWICWRLEKEASQPAQKPKANKASNGQDPSLTETFVKILGEIGNNSLTRLLTKYLSSDDVYVRIAAAWSLWEIGNRHHITIKTDGEHHKLLEDDMHLKIYQFCEWYN